MFYSKCFFVIPVFYAIVQVNGVNESLRGQSPLYGLSALARDNANASLCYQQLSALYEAIESRQPWALKGMLKKIVE